MPLELEGPFNPNESGHILSATSFVHWMWHEQRINDCGGFNSFTSIASYYVRLYPDLYVVWRAEELLLKGKCHHAPK